MLMMTWEEDIKMNLSFPISQGICVKVTDYMRQCQGIPPPGSQEEVS
jgi:hypothetical protein